MLVTIEGGEGSGKTTLIAYLEGLLQDKGISYVSTREPGGTPLGERVRDLFLDRKLHVHRMSELFLILAARAQHVQDVICPALDRGDVVICDRFNDSTVAYQGYGRGLDIDLVKSMCLVACDHIVPDLTFWLDVPSEVGFKRVQGRPFDRMEVEEASFHERVRQGFLDLSQEDRVQRIDAMGSKEDVFASAEEIFWRHFQKS